MRPTRRRSGMTLMEILVVTALASVVLALAFDLAKSTEDFWVSQHDQVEASRTGWQLAHRLAADLRMALPPEVYGEGGIFEGRHGTTNLHAALSEKDWPEEIANDLEKVPIDNDVIRFPCARVAGERGPKQPGMVEYALLRDHEENIIGVQRRTAPRGMALSRAAPTVLDFRTRSLGFAYLKADGEWTAEWPAGAGLPRAVRISVGAEGPPSGGMPQLARFSTVVHLPVGTRIPR